MSPARTAACVWEQMEKKEEGGGGSVEENVLSLQCDSYHHLSKKQDIMKASKYEV